MPMTAERAEELRKAVWASGGWLKVGTLLTPEEDREIIRFWNTLGGGTTYYDAVAKMAKGEHLSKEKP